MSISKGVCNLGDNIDSSAQQEDQEDREELEETNPLDTLELPAEPESKKGKVNIDGSPYKPIPICSQNELIEKARNLSFEQRIVFDLVFAFANSIVRAEKAKEITSVLPPPLLIIHGGGGVGKSYMIKAIAQWTDKIFREAGKRDNPDFPTILLMAFTGVAAKNIGGTTLHSGLSFKFGPDIFDFSPEKLDLTRKRLGTIHILREQRE